MSVSKRAVKANAYKLKGSLKKCGYDRWRYYFNGVNAASGEERLFFIELMSVNPAVSFENTVLAQSESEFGSLREGDLQAALAGNIEVKASPAKNVIPSYACVRAGVFGSRPKQLNRFFANSEFVCQKRVFGVKAGGCAFSDNELYGALSVTEIESRSFKEWKSAAGRMEWNLKYERDFDAPEINSKEGKNWLCGGLTARFSGMVSLDGQEYAVSPDHSFGYIDKSWGTSMGAPCMRIASGRLTSIFTGRVMKDSAFALSGDFDGRLCALAKFENDFYSFGPKQKIKSYKAHWSCARVPEGEKSEELHWSASVHCKKYILDADVFCPASEMLVKDYFAPDGSLLKVLCGGSGSGEIRLYKQIKKALELIQHAKILNASCEYGQIDGQEGE